MLQNETAWDAISFIIAFSGMCIQKVLDRGRIAGVVIESLGQNREKYRDEKLMSSSTADENYVKFPIGLCLQLICFKDFLP